MFRRLLMTPWIRICIRFLIWLQFDFQIPKLHALEPRSKSPYFTSLVCVLGVIIHRNSWYKSNSAFKMLTRAPNTQKRWNKLKSRQILLDRATTVLCSLGLRSCDPIPRDLEALRTRKNKNLHYPKCGFLGPNYSIPFGSQPESVQ